LRLDQAWGLSAQSDLGRAVVSVAAIRVQITGLVEDKAFPKSLAPCQDAFGSKTPAVDPCSPTGKLVDMIGV
jgi:hypothetical protein